MAAHELASGRLAAKLNSRRRGLAQIRQFVLAGLAEEVHVVLDEPQRHELFHV